MGTYDTHGGTPRHDPAADRDRASDLQLAVLYLLEDAGIPTATNDQIMALIEAAERERAEAEMMADLEDEAAVWSGPYEEPRNPKHCPACGDDVADPIPGGYQCLACGCRWAP